MLLVFYCSFQEVSVITCKVKNINDVLGSALFLKFDKFAGANYLAKHKLIIMRFHPTVTYLNVFHEISNNINASFCRISRESQGANLDGEGWARASFTRQPLNCSRAALPHV